jgi:hypothetical protein
MQQNPTEKLLWKQNVFISIILAYRKDSVNLTIRYMKILNTLPANRLTYAVTHLNPTLNKIILTPENMKMILSCKPL